MAVYDTEVDYSKVIAVELTTLETASGTTLKLHFEHRSINITTEPGVVSDDRLRHLFRRAQENILARITQTP